MTDERVINIAKAVVKNAVGKVDSKTLDISIPNGGTNADKDIDIPRGKVVRVAAYISGAEPDKPVNIAIKTQQGTTLVPPTHYKDFIPGKGEHMASRKPVNIEEKNLTVYVSSKTALTADFDVQLVFTLEV